MLLQGRYYYAVGIVIMIAAMLLFAVSFEKKKPKTREIVVVAVMITLAVMGRAAFFMTPQFKPCVAIIIITGIALGRQAGFLTGVMTAFISNFFFGQGPWTPWQMMAFGLIGFCAAVAFHKRYYNKKFFMKDRIIVSLFGMMITLVLYGFLMDTATVLMITDIPDMKAVLSVYAMGFPFNLIHGISTFIFLWCLSEPMLKKLNRITMKYGMYYKVM